MIRRVDPALIRDLVSHTPGGGRTDITLVPGGTPVWSLGVQEHAQIVRRLGGQLDGMQLTIGQDDRTENSAWGVAVEVTGIPGCTCDSEPGGNPPPDRVAGPSDSSMGNWDRPYQLRTDGLPLREDIPPPVRVTCPLMGSRST
ncbi:DUF6119 family protein [Streptomyces sp. NPDC056352]|uniref:DUF6119 family protein n=1 Tax=Streptomyces sp. NPDC056352 TaxID=3345791 RepID=UPI0035DEF423